MTIIVTLDGKIIPASSVNVAITSPPSPPVPPVPPIPPVPPLPPGTLTVGPGKMYPTITTAAGAAPANATLVVDPGLYKESVHFTQAVTLKSASATQRVQVNVTGLAVYNDQGAFVFDHDYVIDGFEIWGATGVNSTNAACIRTNAANVVNGTVRNCNLHHSQTNVLHTGGTFTMDRSDVHHNTGDGQCHTIYVAQFSTNVPTACTITNSRIYHCANGNVVKSNAKSTTLTNCTIGTIDVPAGTSVNRPGESGNPAWFAPAPTTPAGAEWLIYHVDNGVPCVANGYPYDAKAIDIPHGGAFAISGCSIFSGGSSGYLIGYGFEGATNGNAGGTVKGCTFYIERSPTYIGNRVANSTITISGSTFAGVYYPPPTTLDTTDAAGHPVPGAKIVLVP